MIDISDRVPKSLTDRIVSAETAAEYFADGMTIGASGFTPSGYPKAVPLAIAERMKKNPFKVNIWTGASTGPELDGALAEAEGIKQRLPYQTSTPLRNAINSGKVNYIDMHLSEVAQQSREGFLGKIFAAMGLSVTLNRTDTPTGTIFNMHGENLGILIGKHGATLDALQYLTNLVVNKIPETGFARIILDVEDYRARREETLIRLAGHLADKACRIGEEIHLEPMSRHERKIIHMALQDNRRVTTYSAGDNPRRYVVIVPKRRRYGRSEDSYEAYEQ